MAQHNEKHDLAGSILWWFFCTGVTAVLCWTALKILEAMRWAG